MLDKSREFFYLRNCFSVLLCACERKRWITREVWAPESFPARSGLDSGAFNGSFGLGSGKISAAAGEKERALGTKMMGLRRKMRRIRTRKFCLGLAGTNDNNLFLVNFTVRAFFWVQESAVSAIFFHFTTMMLLQNKSMVRGSKNLRYLN